MRNREYDRAYSAKKRQNPEYRAAQAAWNKSWYAINGKDPERLARKAAQMRAYARDPDLRPKHEARWKLNRAIVTGRIQQQPCEVCGSLKVHGHHDDYSKPLDVRWLCPIHHSEHHAKVEGK
jgi:hypothetical protein